MHRSRIRRRSFLTAALAAPALMAFAGCGDDDKAAEELRNVDPAAKAKESMDYYKNNVLKKKKK